MDHTHATDPVTLTPELVQREHTSARLGLQESVISSLLNELAHARAQHVVAQANAKHLEARIATLTAQLAAPSAPTTPHPAPDA